MTLLTAARLVQMLAHKMEIGQQQIPDGNNVYSTLIAPVDLDAALMAIKHAFPSAKSYIYTSGYNGDRTLHLSGELVDFEGYPISDGTGDYLFNGGVAGTDKKVMETAEELFNALKQHGISSTFEVYDGDENMIYSSPSSMS